MSTDVVKIARDRLDEINAERSELDKEAQELKAFIAMHRRLSASGGSQVRSQTMTRTKTPAKYDLSDIKMTFDFSKSHGKSNTQATLDAIERILIEADRPLAPKDIFNVLEAAGIEIPGQVPLNNVSAMLSNAKPRFDNSSGEGWTVGQNETRLATFSVPVRVSN